MNVWENRSAAWPVANPIVTCGSVTDYGFPSNFVADPFLYDKSLLISQWRIVAYAPLAEKPQCFVGATCFNHISITTIKEGLLWCFLIAEAVALQVLIGEESDKEEECAAITQGVPLQESDKLMHKEDEWPLILICNNKNIQYPHFQLGKEKYSYYSPTAHSRRKYSHYSPLLQQESTASQILEGNRIF